MSSYLNFKKLLLVLAAFAAAATLAVGVVYMLSSGPVEEPVFVNPVNSRIYAVLVEAGFEEALVDSNVERTLVAIPVEEGDDAEAVAYYALGASAIVAPEVPLLIAQAYRGGKLVLEVTSKTSDALAFARGEISEQEFKKRTTTRNT